MLLAGEGGAQGGRGSGFSGFWRNIYGAQLFGVGMGRRTQIGRNQESQRGGKEQISEGRRELDRMKDGERERRRKEGEEKKGKGRKGGGREHEIKGWDRYRKLDPRPLFFFFFLIPVRVISCSELLAGTPVWLIWIPCAIFPSFLYPGLQSNTHSDEQAQTAHLQSTQHGSKDLPCVSPLSLQ